jgi:hypothetical protein
MHALSVNLRTAGRYVIYALLCLNVAWFFRGELSASELLGTADGFKTLITVFSETFDTLAWVVLILLFELEVSHIAPERLHGRLQWLLIALRMACYSVIVFALGGYWLMWETVTTLQPAGDIDPCTLAEQGYRYVAGLDRYPGLTSTTCQLLANEPLAFIDGTRILGSIAQLEHIGQIAMIDVINASAWLMVVIIMEAEVFLELLDRFDTRWVRISKWLLGPLYLVLLSCAGYWLRHGEWLDAWDALLWLIAFAFIELNILDWQARRQDHARPLPESAHRP